VIEDAIRRELDRGGQVFFVHNRVETIQTLASGCAAGARRHGRRRARADAGEGAGGGDAPVPGRRVDILVTTSIIENGLDVPSANTLIVDRADQFGLSQLYQIRGRVGRSHHRAYCYLLIPENVIRGRGEAAARAGALHRARQRLRIALKDLELRGAGNILGSEQSGFVHAVGLDTYMRLLEDTIRRMKGEAFEPADVSPGRRRVPAGRVRPDPAQKLHLYRRLSKLAGTRRRCSALQAEIRDRYGPPPPEVERLLLAARLRLVGSGRRRAHPSSRRRRARHFRAGRHTASPPCRRRCRTARIGIEVTPHRPAPSSSVARGCARHRDTLAVALDALDRRHGRGPTAARNARREGTRARRGLDRKDRIGWRMR
jgi:transcription-repair coupling factor (superfamily II helicase)